MDPPSSAVSREALQRRAYLLAEAAGFPPGQSERFWLMAEQELTPGEPVPAATDAPTRKAAARAKRKTPPAPVVTAPEAAPVHPTRRKPATKAAALPTTKPATTVPAKSAPAKTQQAKTTPAKPTKKAQPKSAVTPPPKPDAPAAKRSAKPRQTKTGDAP